MLKEKALGGDNQTLAILKRASSCAGHFGAATARGKLNLTAPLPALMSCDQACRQRQCAGLSTAAAEIRRALPDMCETRRELSSFIVGGIGLSTAAWRMCRASVNHLGAASARVFKASKALEIVSAARPLAAAVKLDVSRVAMSRKWRCMARDLAYNEARGRLSMAAPINIGEK